MRYRRYKSAYRVLDMQIVISCQLSVISLREENPPQSSFSKGGRKRKKASSAPRETQSLSNVERSNGCMPQHLTSEVLDNNLDIGSVSVFSLYPPMRNAGLYRTKKFPSEVDDPTAKLR